MRWSRSVVPWCQWRGLLSEQRRHLRDRRMAQSPPLSLSDERMPRELKERDAENYDVSLAYDMKDNAVVIFITPQDGSAGTHWWFDPDDEQLLEVCVLRR